MRYSEINIKNYKGIDEVELNLNNERIYTLVGLNESGKTTILESVALFYRLIKGESLENTELNSIRPKSISFSGGITISAKLLLDDEDKKKIQKIVKEVGSRSKLEISDNFLYTFEFIFDKNQYVETKETVSFDIRSQNAKKSLSDTNKELETTIIKHIRTILVPEILFYEDFIFEIPENIFFLLRNEEQLLSPTEDTRNNQWQLVLDDILKAVDRDLDSFRKYVVEVWESDNDTARQRLTAMEGILNTKITKAWKNLFDDKNKKEERLNFKEIKLVPSEKENKLKLSFKVKTDNNREFSINERSKGCKWFFAFLIFTEFRKKRTDNILFLLDEPASNLHSSAQLKILEALKDLSEESVVIYSTHSHHLINPIWLNGAFVVINNSISTGDLIGALTDSSDGGQISAHKYYNFVNKNKQSDQIIFFQPIFDQLDYKPSLIEPSKNTVITEGKYDWYVYKYVSLLLNISDINFYPGKGANSNTEIIRLYLAQGNNFIVLNDSDKAGIDGKSLYINEIGPIIDKRVITYMDILNKSIATEDIFTKTDKRSVINSAFGKGAFENIENADSKEMKSKFNFAVMNLLSSKKKIVLSKSTKTKFKEIMTKLQFLLNNENL